MLSEAKHLRLFPLLGQSRFNQRFFASLRMTSCDALSITLALAHGFPVNKGRATRQRHRVSVPRAMAFPFHGQDFVSYGERFDLFV